MAKVTVYNLQGERTEEAELNSEIFEVKLSPGVVQQVVVAELANTRNTVAHTKTRGEVRGGGKKPWKQKGTGRARVGSIRSPLWRGGGIIFGPRSNRNFSKKVSKKLFQKALFMVLSDKLAEKNLFVLNDVKQEKISTKNFAATLNTLREKIKLPASNCLIIAEPDQILQKSARNLQGVSVLQLPQMSVRQLMLHPGLILTSKSLQSINKMKAKRVA